MAHNKSHHSVDTFVNKTLLSVGAADVNTSAVSEAISVYYPAAGRVTQSTLFYMTPGTSSEVRIEGSPDESVWASVGTIPRASGFLEITDPHKFFRAQKTSITVSVSTAFNVVVCYTSTGREK